ncbi:MAG: NADH-quinone oxidoreductase subunit C [Desulfobulbus propionicus]|nr:MAG: NADH-quinone oxidoreductase subunit C [Desulfobulbus propionicus]
MYTLNETREALRALIHARESEVTVPETANEEQEKTEKTKAQLPGIQDTEYSKHGSHLDVICIPEQLVEISSLLDSHQYFLESISGVDWLKKEQLEIIYDYSRFEESFRITVRVFVPRDQPCLPTISTIIPGANWHERETFDFYGVKFEGHPDLTRILLPEDADFYPLLKDYIP